LQQKQQRIGGLEKSNENFGVLLEQERELRENEYVMTKQRKKILAENEKGKQIKLMEENNAIKNEFGKGQIIYSNDLKK
jgi:hypothetical protein